MSTYHKVILLILNCNKYRHKALKQKEGWLSKIELPYFHVIGNPELTCEYIIDETERILYLKVEDDYISLPKKIIKAYEVINENYKFDYIFKTDDDQNLVNISFLNILQNILFSEKSPKTHYGGYVVSINNPHISKYNLIHPELPSDLLILETTYCSGRFYFLSSESVKSLILKKELINSEYFEDYAIGLNLEKPFKLNILSIDTNKHFKDFV